MTLPTAKAHCYLVVILAFLENLLTFSDDEQQKSAYFPTQRIFQTEVNGMELDPFQKICFTVLSSAHLYSLNAVLIIYFHIFSSL